MSTMPIFAGQLLIVAGRFITIEEPPIATAPGQFQTGDWFVVDKATDGVATVTMTNLPSNGGADFTDIEYQVDTGGWVTSGQTTTSSFDISGLTNDVEVDISLRAENSEGFGTASATKAVTPSLSAPAAFLVWNDVGHSGTLTNYTGPLEILVDNTTLENFRFPSTITQNENTDNLTFRNCHFDCSGPNYCFNNEYNKSPATSVTFEDCTFEGALGSGVIVGGSGTTSFTRCQWRDNRTDTIKLFGSADHSFIDCYFGPLSRTEYGAEDFHADTFQNTHSGTTLMLRCTWDAPPSVGGLQIQITPGSWLESDGIAAGGVVPNIFYRSTIGYFEFGGSTAVSTFTDCHFVRMGSNGIQFKDDVANSCETRISGCAFYPAGIYNTKTGGSDGTWTDLGGNYWAATGNDLTGTPRVEGTALVF